jgi:hypothetical protein
MVRRVGGLTPGHEAQRREHEQAGDGDRERERIEAEAARHADRADHPDARPRGRAEQLESPWMIAAAPKKPIAPTIASITPIGSISRVEGPPASSWTSCRAIRLKLAAPSATSMLVRRPSGLCLTSRSMPTAALSTMAKARRKPASWMLAGPPSRAHWNDNSSLSPSISSPQAPPLRLVRTKDGLRDQRPQQFHVSATGGQGEGVRAGALAGNRRGSGRAIPRRSFLRAASSFVVDDLRMDVPPIPPSRFCRVPRAHRRAYV